MSFVCLCVGLTIPANDILDLIWLFPVANVNKQLVTFHIIRWNMTRCEMLADVCGLQLLVIALLHP